MPDAPLPQKVQGRWARAWHREHGHAVGQVVHPNRWVTVLIMQGDAGRRRPKRLYSEGRPARLAPGCALRGSRRRANGGDGRAKLRERTLRYATSGARRTDDATARDNAGGPGPSPGPLGRAGRRGRAIPVNAYPNYTCPGPRVPCAALAAPAPRAMPTTPPRGWRRQGRARWDLGTNMG